MIEFTYYVQSLGSLLTGRMFKLPCSEHRAMTFRPALDYL